jgi:predicted methyltransferase
LFDPADVSDEGTKGYYERNNQAFKDKLAANPELYGEVRMVEMGQKEPRLGAPDSADLVLTFRNVHNWVDGGNDAAMFEAFFEVLKPGGTLGVVEHRAKAGTARETWIESGYMPEETVIGLATAAGFELAGKSEINANANDTTDHPKGVWTLPPALALKEVDREKYLAIGESDRMTLRFVKPATAAAAAPEAAATPAETPAG